MVHGDVFRPPPYLMFFSAAVGTGVQMLALVGCVLFLTVVGTFYPGDRGALAAHVDFVPTIAEIAGAKPMGKVRAQVEGRSLVPVLEDPAAAWPERTLFTHVGRWPKGADPETAKYRACSVRTPRWHLVSPDGAREPHWMLFDVPADPGEQTDLVSGHPEVVRELSARYEVWWASVRGSFSNERAEGPAINPFKARYWRQFGGGPSAEDLRLMNMEGNPATRGQRTADEGKGKQGDGRPWLPR
jgi:arylsulfatase